MKKILVLLLSLVMCLGVFASCTPTEEKADNQLDEAVAYLFNLYKDSPADTSVDYDVAGKILIGQTAFTVTWTVDTDKVTIKESTTAGFWTVDVPEANETATPYNITATVKAADGATANKSFARNLPVYDNSAVVSEPTEGTAYKFFMVQAGIGKTLYGTHELSSNKYIKSTTDAKAAPDFFAEKVDGGYKFYTLINNVKNYVTGSLILEEGKTNKSKYLNYANAENATVWTYDADCNAWMTTLEGTKYCVGTYGTYDTFCISEASYITPDNTGKSQFPAGLIPKEKAENAVVEDNAPDIYTTPEQIVEEAYKLEKDTVLSQSHKYTLTGVITEINSAYADQYKNVTVTIVVGNMTDKPIECFRMKGEGAEAIKVGDNITVTGVIKNYNGKVEFDAGCTLDSYKTPEQIVTELYALAKDAKLDGKYTLTGVVTTVDTPYSEQYKNVTVTIKVGDLTDKPVICFRVKGPGADTVKVGDTVTVYGELMNYGGTFEFNSGCVFVPAAAAE